MPGDNLTDADNKKVTPKSLAKQLFDLYEIVFIILISFSIIGFGITDFSPGDSHRYWFAMVPVFAGACLLLEWDRARNKGQKYDSFGDPTSALGRSAAGRSNRIYDVSRRTPG
jgi:hypothetical protein